MIEKVVEKWRQENVGLLPAGNKSEVVATFIKLGRNVSPDVIKLYCVTGGMEGMDSFCWSFWPLDRIIVENESHARPYIWFADFLLDSHYYCFKYEDPGRSSVYLDWLNKNLNVWQKAWMSSLNTISNAQRRFIYLISRIIAANSLKRRVITWTNF